MKCNRNTWYTVRPWLFIFLGIGISIGVIFAIKLTRASEIITVLGTSASMVGIAITMAQVSSIKKEVKKHNETIRTSHNISDFRKASGWIDDILHAISLKEYGLAHNKTAELVKFLVEQKSNTQLDIPQEWDSRVDSLTMDTLNLYKKMDDKSIYLNVMEVSKDLEDTRQMMAKISGKLENKGYESENN